MASTPIADTDFGFRFKTSCASFTAILEIAGVRFVERQIRALHEAARIVLRVRRPLRRPLHVRE